MLINTCFIAHFREMSFRLVSSGAGRHKARRTRDAPSSPISKLARACCLIRVVESGGNPREVFCMWSQSSHLQRGLAKLVCDHPRRTPAAHMRSAGSLQETDSDLCPSSHTVGRRHESVHGEFLGPCLATQIPVYTSHSIEILMGHHLKISKCPIKTLVIILQLGNLKRSQVRKGAQSHTENDRSGKSAHAARPHMSFLSTKAHCLSRVSSKQSGSLNVVSASPTLNAHQQPIL